MLSRPFLRRLSATFLAWLGVLFLVRLLLTRPRGDAWIGYAVLQSGGIAIGVTESAAVFISVIFYLAVLILPPILMAWIWNRRTGGSA